MKWFVAMLAVVNLALFAWWNGYLSPVLHPPGFSEREPIRATRQLHPQAVTVIGSEPERPGTAAAPAAGAVAPPAAASGPLR